MGLFFVKTIFFLVCWILRIACKCNQSDKSLIFSYAPCKVGKFIDGSKSQNRPSTFRIPMCQPSTCQIREKRLVADPSNCRWYKISTPSRCLSCQGADPSCWDCLVVSWHNTNFYKKKFCPNIFEFLALITVLCM
jgi:hypothetical protein